MSTAQLWVLGAIAGLTIFLGLPIGRIRNPALRLRALLNAVAIGVLVFLFFDILGHGNEIVEGALDAAKDGAGSWWRFLGYALMLAVGLGIGLIGLVVYEQRLPTGGHPVGAATRMAAASTTTRFLPTRAHRLAFYIALGIGLHNFAEGLAIGQSAARGDISLALLLVIGFGLHNATEGFGILAPMAADGERPSIEFLVVMGLIGGGPTFVGTIVGNSFVNDALYLAFLALAAGSILYVVVQLVQVAARLGHRQLLFVGIFGGLLAGLATDYILVAAGA